ncbi:conserved hypothetical protein [Verrucomicrobia bacterium]|nr:conserved hypothetical protein [Verrucomicrobiota bacterium]
MKNLTSANSSLDALRNPAPRQRVNFLMAVLLIAAIGAALYEGRRAAHQEQKLQLLAAQIQQLETERDEALNRLAAASAEGAPRLTAAMPVIVQPGGLSLENLQSTNLYDRLKDQAPQLSAEQVEAYLKANGRHPANLLAAYRTSGDAALLKEAMEKYPNDPQVAFEAIFAKDLAPEQRRQWLNAFEQNAPDNPLANYLSARDYLKAGQTDQAMQELTAASGKGQFQDYTLGRRQDDEEAYLAAGYPTAEAKIIASSQVQLPQLAELKQLGLQMVDLSNSYRTAGDDAAAQSVLQMAVGLGQSYSSGDCAISHLVGLAIQRIALGAMDPNSPYGDSGQTVQQQLDQLSQQKTAISTLFRENEPLLETLSAQDWISYIDRDKSFGEEAALRWVVSKHGQN